MKFVDSYKVIQGGKSGANVEVALVGRKHVCQHWGHALVVGSRQKGTAIGPINADNSISGLTIGYIFDL